MRVSWLLHLRPLFRPLQSNVFSLFTLPLSMLDSEEEHEKALAHVVRFVPGPQAVVSGGGGKLAVNCLRFLLQLLLQNIAEAEEHSRSPLAAVHNKFVRPADEEMGTRSAHSSEQINTIELVQSLMPVLPHMGSVRNQAQSHTVAGAVGRLGSSPPLSSCVSSFCLFAVRL